MKRSRGVAGPIFFITRNTREDIVFTKLEKVAKMFFGNGENTGISLRHDGNQGAACALYSRKYRMQALDLFPACRCLQVQDDALLSPVPLEGAGQMAEGVSTRGLQLDDLGAEV